MRDELVQRVIATGLHADEAIAQGEIWFEGLVELEGITLFSRIPESTYDEWLPLKTSPPGFAAAWSSTGGWNPSSSRSWRLR